MTTPSPAKPAVTPQRAGFGAAAVLAAAIAVIAPWEGKRNETYLDIVGVATVCYGQTGPAARPGARYTDAECAAMLGAEVAHFGRQLEACISPQARMNAQQQAVVLSWAYNVGARAACTSTLVRKLNAGRPPAEWCAELLRWNRAGGQVVRGLDNRRKHEYRLCIGA